MKKDTRYNLGFVARLRLFVRVLGLTGVLAGFVGLFIWLALAQPLTVTAIRDSLQATGTVQVAAYLMAIGVGLAALVLLFELLAILGGSTRRSATGLNSAVQFVLVLAVVGGLNYFAFHYFKRWDLTRDKAFTLSPEVSNELRKVSGKTTIVVLQRHNTFGNLTDPREAREAADRKAAQAIRDEREAGRAFEFAAERKVVDKVRDLVDQFRLLGPQFSVVTLDVEAFEYKDQLEALTYDRPGLKDAINSTSVNSIFFYPDDQVERIDVFEAARRQAAGRWLSTQPPTMNGELLAFEGNIPRLTFNEFYLLDKSASKAANPGADGKARGNLVLRPQGVETFARRILAIQEKRPKVGLLVIHELLTSSRDTTERNPYTSVGLRQALEANGFEVVDVVVKKFGDPTGPKPAAFNLTETQYERLEAVREGLEEDRRSMLEDRKDAEDTLTLFREKTAAELDKAIGRQIGRQVTEEFRQAQIRGITDALKQMAERLAEIDQDVRDTDAQITALMKNERAFEDRRVTDVKAKLTRLVADCDLLIVPRLTVMNASAANENIPGSLYNLSAEQVEVLKDYLKTGKPLMVCAGPNVEQNQPASREPLDDVERLLTDRGVQLGRETIITTAEAKAFAARRTGDQFGGAGVALPPVTFPDVPEGTRDNPVAAAMRATSASADQKLDLRLQNPRPVYLAAGLENRVPFHAEFLMSPAAAWNEENPILVRNIGGGRGIQLPPRFKPTPFNDPKKGTRDEVRRGPFPVAVAVESTLPAEWFDSDLPGYRGLTSISTSLDGGLLAAGLTAKTSLSRDAAKDALVPQTIRKTGRLVVIGHGGVFTGPQLPPANEQLLLHSCNWLLHRDERLPKTDSEWSYPRLNRDDRDNFLWRNGATFGLPLLFLYVGLIVLIVRRVR
jgi:hypothetical protein